MTQVKIYKWPESPMKYSKALDIMAKIREDGYVVRTAIEQDHITYYVELDNDAEAIIFRLSYL